MENPSSDASARSSPEPYNPRHEPLTRPTSLRRDTGRQVGPIREQDAENRRRLDGARSSGAQDGPESVDQALAPPATRVGGHHGHQRQNDYDQDGVQNPPYGRYRGRE